MKGRAVVAATTVVLTMFVTSAAHAGTDVGPAGIQVSTPSPATFTSYGGMRLGSIGSTANTGDEFLGVADLAPTTNRIEANFTVPRFLLNGNTGSRSGDCQGTYAVGTVANPSANRFTMTWDRSAGTLTSTLSDPSLSCTVVFTNFTQELATAKGWSLAQAQAALNDVDSLRLSVDDRQTGTKMVLSGATVDAGVSLGSFNPGCRLEQGLARVRVRLRRSERFHRRRFARSRRLVRYVRRHLRSSDHLRPFHTPEPAPGGAGARRQRVG